jgi:phosphopantothenoylcysteine decarboxylase/phosphopantothenate--cysteine ligase
MDKTTHILITAGPTHERIDDVRYLANRSSGRMGIALTQAALDADCDVTLLLGPVSTGLEGITESAEHRRDAARLSSPKSDATSLRVERFESTADLERLLDSNFPACDVLIMAAAVADYRPAVQVAGKLPRRDDKFVLELEPTPDLVAGCVARRRPGQRIIAFALEEPGSLTQRATEKMRAKGVDAIVANPLATMGSETVTATVYTSAGQTFAPDPPSADKPTFATWLIRRILTNISEP